MIRFLSWPQHCLLPPNSWPLGQSDGVGWGGGGREGSNIVITHTLTWHIRPISVKVGTTLMLMFLFNKKVKGIDVFFAMTTPLRLSLCFVIFLFCFCTCFNLFYIHAFLSSFHSCLCFFSLSVSSFILCPISIMFIFVLFSSFYFGLYFSDRLFSVSFVQHFQTHSC